MACRKFASRNGSTLYSMVTSVGPLSLSPGTTADGTGQCSDGVRSMPSAEVKDSQRLVIVHITAMIAAIINTGDMVSRLANAPHRMLPTAIEPKKNTN